MKVGTYETHYAILYYLHNLKKHENHPWRSDSFKSATLLKVPLLHGCVLCFLNCTNGIKSCNVSHMFAIVYLEISKYNLNIKSTKLSAFLKK